MATGGHICRQTGTTFGQTQLDHWWNISGKFQDNPTSVDTLQVISDAVSITYHCSWASLLGSLPVLSAYSFASNWQLPFLNQQEGREWP